MEIKTTAAAGKLSLKYCLMSDCNTCIIEPNLEVLPLIKIIQERTRLVSFYLKC